MHAHDDYDHHHDGDDHAHQHSRLRHSHAHAVVDRAMEDSGDGVRALKISLLGLAVTAVLQLVLVVLTGSVALLSDTLHNFADALTAIPLWLAFVVGRRQPTRRLTYGYGRAEDLAGLVVVLFIAASGVFAVSEALSKLRHPDAVRHLGAVIAAGLVGMVGNELVAQYRIRVGRRIGSAALVADGLHARADGFTSLAVVAGAAGVGLGWERADAVAGLLIGLAILGVLVQALRGIGERLMDAVSPALVEQAETVVREIPGVEEVTELRIRWIGHRLHAEVRITVDRDLGVVQAHTIAEDAQHGLLHRLPMLAGAVVHVDPCQHAGADPHAATAHHFGAVG